MGYQFADDKFSIKPIDDIDRDSEYDESCYESDSDDSTDSDDGDIIETKEELACIIDNLVYENRSLTRSIMNERALVSILKQDKIKLQSMMIGMLFAIILGMVMLRKVTIVVNIL